MKKDRKMVQDALMMVFEFGINMIVPILLCTFAGVWLGEKLDKDWVVIPLFFVGALAGYTNIYKRVKKYIDAPETKKEKNVKKD